MVGSGAPTIAKQFAPPEACKDRRLDKPLTDHCNAISQPALINARQSKLL
jgi:hypothetical protein